MSRFAVLCIALLAGVSALTCDLLAREAPEVRPDEMPDLTAIELRVEPEYPQPGEDVRAELTIRNGCPSQTDGFCRV